MYIHSFTLVLLSHRTSAIQIFHYLPKLKIFKNINIESKLISSHLLEIHIYLYIHTCKLL